MWRIMSVSEYMNNERARIENSWYTLFYDFVVTHTHIHMQVWLASIVRARSNGEIPELVPTASARFDIVGFVAIFRYQCHQLRIVWIIRWTWNNDDGVHEDRKHNSRFHGSIERESATSGFTGPWYINANYHRVSIPLKA